MTRTTLTVMLAGLLAATPALAAGIVRHSGTVAAFDPATHTLVLEEMGPWTPRRPALTARSIEFGPATKFELITRSRTFGPHGWRHGFTASPVEASAVQPGDFATVTTVRKADRLEALSVDVVRPATRPVVTPPATTGRQQS